MGRKGLPLLIRSINGSSDPGRGAEALDCHLPLVPHIVMSVLSPGPAAGCNPARQGAALSPEAGQPRDLCEAPLHQGKAPRKNGPPGGLGPAALPAAEPRGCKSRDYDFFLASPKRPRPQMESTVHCDKAASREEARPRPAPAASG